MAVPRLTSSRCFVELTAEDLQQRNIPLEEAAIAEHLNLPYVSVCCLLPFEKLNSKPLIYASMGTLQNRFIPLLSLSGMS
jgi:hypothetical protein